MLSSDQQGAPANVAYKPVNVVARAAAVLEAVARASTEGARLIDLAAATGIARPSVHRLLQDLTDVGYIEQGADRLYRLGSGLFMLGLNAPTPGWDLTAIRPIAQHLAEISEDTVYVSVRQFDGVHYLLRAEGAYPIRAQLVDVGDTKPYTSSYSGLALLATLGESEQGKALASRTFDVPEGWLGETDVDALLRAKIADVKSIGYCGGASVVMPGVAGMAAPVPSRTRNPYMAVSVSAVESRLTPARMSDLAPHLLEAAQQISLLIP
jgi:DNA-binding IclR family transcriptional regulator